MKNSTYAKLGTGVALVTLAAFLLTPTQTNVQNSILAKPTLIPTPLPTMQSSYVLNSSLEPPYSTQIHPEITIADKWTAWYIDTPYCRAGKVGCDIPCPLHCQDQNGLCSKTDTACYWARPEFKPIYQWDYPRIVHTGEASQDGFVYGRQGTYGLYQSIPITKGITIKASAFVRAWTCFNFQDCCSTYPCHSDYKQSANLQIGIDPYGGNSYTSTNIIWSAPVESFDAWRQTATVARTLSPTITIFLKSSLRFSLGWATTNNDAYWDDISISVLPTNTQLYIPFVRNGVTASKATQSINLASTSVIIAPFSSTISVGQVQTYSVSVYPSKDFQAAELQLGYDCDKIEIVDIGMGNFFSEPLDAYWYLNKCVLHISVEANSPTTKTDGILVWIYARGLKEGTTEIAPVSRIALFFGVAGGGGLNVYDARVHYPKIKVIE